MANPEKQVSCHPLDSIVSTLSVHRSDTGKLTLQRHGTFITSDKHHSRK